MRHLVLALSLFCQPAFAETPLYDAGSPVLVLESVPGGVNHLRIFNAATGTEPGMRAEGPDLHLGINMVRKGQSAFRIYGFDSNPIGIELGLGLTADRNVIFDMHASVDQPDYSFRILRTAGADGSTKLMNLGGGRIGLHTGGIERAYIAHNGFNMTGGGVYRVQGLQVVGARDTGWSPMTGTANKASSIDTSTATVAQLAERLKAIEALLIQHGLAGQ